MLNRRRRSLRTNRQMAKASARNLPSMTRISESADLPTQPQQESVNICGIPVANLTEDEAVSAISNLIATAGAHYATVVNAAKIVAANRDPGLRQILLEADFVTADGMSVVWASRLLGKPLKQRVTGIELFQR